MRTSKKIALTSLVLIFLLILIYRNCRPLNISQGNIPTYVCVSSQYNIETFYRYCDTFLLLHPEYESPVENTTKDNWSHLRMTRFYFREAPEEMYDVSIGTFTCVRAIHQMRNGIMVGSLEEPSAADNERMKSRMESVKKEIEHLIEESNLPDSLKYDQVSK